LEREPCHPLEGNGCCGEKMMAREKSLVDYYWIEWA